MHIARRDFLKYTGATAAALAVPATVTAALAGRQPIIDVHMHAYPASMKLPFPVVNPITRVKSPITTGAEHLTACIDQMKRYNIVRRGQRRRWRSVAGRL